MPLSDFSKERLVSNLEALIKPSQPDVKAVINNSDPNEDSLRMPITYKRVKVFQVRGLSLESDQDCFEIIDDPNIKDPYFADMKNHRFIDGPSHHLRAVITKDYSKYNDNIDRWVVLASVLTAIMFNDVGEVPSDYDFEGGVRGQVERIRNERKEGYQDSLFIVVEVAGVADAFSFSYFIETNECIICLEACLKGHLDLKSDHHIKTALSSFQHTVENVLEFTMESDGIVYFTPFGKPVFSFGSDMALDAYVCKRLDASLALSSNATYHVLRQNPVLETSAQLLTDSIQTEKDRIRAFFNAWTALEILVVKSFDDYRNWAIVQNTWMKIAQEIKVFNSRNNAKTSKEIGFYTAEKFYVMCCALGSQDVDSDSDEFVRIKDLRNKFFHERSVSEQVLPVEALQSLTRKYLNLYVSACKVIVDGRQSVHAVQP